MFDIQNLGGLIHSRINLCLGHFGKFQAKSHVLTQAHVRIQRVRLKHHGNTAIRWRDIVHQPTTNLEFTRADVFKAGNYPQQSRLATARRTDKHHELAIFDFQVDVLQHMDVAKGLAYIKQSNICHKNLTLPLARNEK